MRVLQVQNEVFLPAVLEQLKENPEKTATINLRGRSMRPFLEDGRDKAMLQLLKEPCRVGEPVLAEIAPGHFVLHRIVKMDQGKVTLRGDGNLSDEHCTEDDIRAKAVGFFRKGRTKPDLISGRKWRTYSWIWMRLFPIRRYLLFALHPHVPNFLKKKKQQ
ncbi:MAG: S24/S26 family peptidase [Prevotella sp.]|nr:S24/S26 family peptidase [Prevotella sp.]